LTNAIRQRADLTGAKLADANLTRCLLEQATADSSNELDPKALLSWKLNNTDQTGDVVILDILKPHQSEEAIEAVEAAGARVLPLSVNRPESLRV
jgi:hypothetical protein